ncbi:MAG: polyprenyl diphosphate synthase [Candidatus Bathyarchaeia archaeon]
MLRALLSLLGVYKIYEKWLWHQVKNKSLPGHIAIILDGNRRWATKSGLKPWMGHFYGARKVEEVLKWCLDLGVKTITLYALSTENFQRPREEVEKLIELFKEKLRELLVSEEIRRYGVRVKVIGRIYLLPQDLQEIIYKIEEETKDFSECYLNLAIAYGGRAEIIDTVRKVAQKVAKGELSPEEISESIFEQHLYTSFLPKQDPDLIIRTSGEERLSGFLLYQSAYSELCFLDVYWPEFRRIDLLRAIRTYQKRVRRFGK